MHKMKICSLSRRLPSYACKFLELCLMMTADHGPAVSGALPLLLLLAAIRRQNRISFHCQANLPHLRFVHLAPATWLFCNLWPGLHIVSQVLTTRSYAPGPGKTWYPASRPDSWRLWVSDHHHRRTALELWLGRRSGLCRGKCGERLCTLNAEMCFFCESKIS